MASWAQQAKDALDALGATPTADDARRVTDRYDDTDVEAALASLVAAAGGGGSQPGAARLLGPYSVDFGDFADGEGAKRDLVALPVGTAILGWWSDPDTRVEWDNTGDGYIGQGSGWHPFNGVSVSGQWGEVLTGGQDLSADAEADAAAGNRFPLDGALGQKTVLAVTQDISPVQIWWTIDGETPATAPSVGHSDVYLLIALAPTAPTDLT